MFEKFDSGATSLQPSLGGPVEIKGGRCVSTIFSQGSNPIAAGVRQSSSEDSEEVSPAKLVMKISVSNKSSQGFHVPLDSAKDKKDPCETQYIEQNRDKLSESPLNHVVFSDVIEENAAKAIYLENSELKLPKS